MFCAFVDAAPIQAASSRAITLSFAQPAPNLSACSSVTLSWSTTGSVDLSRVFVQSADIASNFNETIAENVQATNDNTVEWIVDVPSGWYTLSGRATSDEAEVVSSPPFFVAENQGLHCDPAVKVVSAAQSTPESTSTHSGPNTGAIAGAVVGVILALVLVGTLLWHYRTREHAPRRPTSVVQRHELDRRDSDSTVVDIVGRPPTPLGIAVLGRTVSKPLDAEQTQKVLRGL